MAFDPKKHVIRVQGGREYLPVSARLIWFRSDHPDWGIVTQVVELNLEKQYAIFQASIFNEAGKLMATATKMENVRGFPDYIEKAETGSVGRALALCGYGTQFAPELEEGDRLADAPRGGGNRYGTGPGPRPGGGNGYGGGNRPMSGGGGGGPMQRAERAPERAERPAPPPPPPPADEDDVFAEDIPAASAPRPTSGPMNRGAESRAAAPAPSPARPSGGITRVREPERDLPDPGGPDEDDEDPFADDDFAEPAPPPAPPARRTPEPASARREAPARQSDGDSGGDNDEAPAKPNVLAGNNCSVEGCTNVLTAPQMTMSMNKFGKAICILHQKDPAVTGAASGGGGSRRPANRAAAQSEPLL